MLVNEVKKRSVSGDSPDAIEIRSAIDVVETKKSRGAESLLDILNANKDAMAKTKSVAFWATIKF
jgi:hypothetical protein